jgi:hypothetical protein
LDVLDRVTRRVDDGAFDSRHRDALQLEVHTWPLLADPERNRRRLRDERRPRIVDGRVPRRLFFLLLRDFELQHVRAHGELARGGGIGPAEPLLDRFELRLEPRRVHRGRAARRRGDDILPRLQTVDAIDAAIVGRSRA